MECSPIVTNFGSSLVVEFPSLYTPQVTNTHRKHALLSYADAARFVKAARVPIYGQLICGHATNNFFGQIYFNFRMDKRELTH